MENDGSEGAVCDHTVTPWEALIGSYEGSVCLSYEYTAVSALAGLLMFAVLVGGVQWVVRHALQGSPDVEPNFEGPELSLREAANRQRAETNDRAE